MAIIQMDGFEHYPHHPVNLITDPLGLANVWTSVTGVSASSVAEAPGRYLQATYSNHPTFNLVVGFTHRNGIIVGFRLRTPVSFTTAMTMTITFSPPNSEDPSSSVTLNGSTLSIDRPSSQSRSFVLNINQWYHFEILYFLTGITVYIDDVAVLIASGATININNVTLNFRTSSGQQTIHLDDLYVLDSTGTFANARLGSQARIQYLTPGASGQNAGWGFTGSSDWASASTVDSHHVTGSTPGATMTTPLTDLVNPNVAIKAARFHDISQNADPVLFTLRRIIMDGTNQVPFGVDHTPVALQWNRRMHWMNTNPLTGQQWTAAQINAAEMGVRVV